MKHGFGNFIAVMMFMVVATLGEKYAGFSVSDNIAIVTLWTLLEVKDLLKDKQG